MCIVLFSRNTYKLNVKEDLKYIITNMTLKKKEVIVKELEAFDITFFLLEAILSFFKQKLINLIIKL